MKKIKNMTPQEIVSQLDKYIIGQNEAKRNVAIALRNRWRRLNVKDEIKNEIIPNNILMIGATGVGKTEIARILFSTYLFGNQILFGIFEMKLSSFQLAISKTRHAIKTKAARLDVEKMPSALNSSENHPLSDATSWKNVRLSNNKV